MIARPETKFSGKPFRDSDEWHEQENNVNCDVPQSVYESYIVAIKHDPCCWCNHKGGTRDHIIPRSAGGSNHWSNVSGACAYCNHRRSSTSLLEWLRVRLARQQLKHTA